MAKAWAFVQFQGASYSGLPIRYPGQETIFLTGERHLSRLSLEVYFS